MIPPIVRRCPACGHVAWSRRFAVIDGGGQYLVECPRYKHRFEPIEKPWHT
jgi:hypothetical protein